MVHRSPRGEGGSLVATLYVGEQGSARGSAIGEVVDINLREVTLRFSGDPPDLPLGEQVEIVLESERLPGPHRLEAEACLRFEEPGARCYRLEFRDADRIADVMELVYERLFDRRRASRVCPRFPGEVPVYLSTVEDGLHRVAVRLLNLSEAGIGLSASPGLDRVLADQEQVDLELRLPGETDEAALRGSIRSRRLVRESLIYGLAFVREPESEADREAVRAYVDARRAEVAGRPYEEEDTARPVPKR